MHNRATRNLLLLTAVAALAVGGCYYPRRYACYRTCAHSEGVVVISRRPLPPPGLRPSGFLSDYDVLRAHPEEKGSYIWEKEGLDLRVYDNLLIDEIQVILDEETAKQVPEKVRTVAGEYFKKILYETIDPYYSVVDAPGEHVLRVKLALTDLTPAAEAAEGEPAIGTGSAELEGELLDSVSGERLLMVVSRIEGSERGSTEVEQEWQPVEGAFREWADRLLDFLDSFKE